MRTTILYFAQMNVKLRYRSSYLGILWAALEPLFIFTILYVVFSQIHDSSSEYAIYLITGVTFYSIFTKGTMAGLSSIVQNASILKSINVRKDVFPVVTTTASGLLLFVNVGIFFALMPIFNFTPSWTLLFLPVLLVMLLLLILGISYFLSVLYVYARDLQPFWSVINYGLMFITPVFWKLDQVDGILLSFHSINPLGQIIELGHQVVFNQTPSIDQWAYAVLLIMIVLISGYGIFYKLESRISEQL